MRHVFSCNTEENALANLKSGHIASGQIASTSAGAASVVQVGVKSAIRNNKSDRELDKRIAAQSRDARSRTRLLCPYSTFGQIADPVPAFIPTRCML